MLAATLVMAGGSWLAVFSPWSTVQRVKVTGLDRVSAAEVQQITDPEIGHPLLLVRSAAVSEQVGNLRLVKSVQVTRSWPGTLKVAVTEREPVAALLPVTAQDDSDTDDSAATDGSASSGGSDDSATADGSGSTDTTDTATGSTTNSSDKTSDKTSQQKVQLVDEDGVVVETVLAADIPDDLPQIEVTLGAAQSVQTLRSTVAVVDGLPKTLRERLTAIGADSPDGIWLRLSAPVAGSPDRTVLVQWGDAEQGGKKAKVLLTLLKKQASTYDVQAPDMPSTSS